MGDGSARSGAPPAVSLHVWRVPRRAVPAALWRLAVERHRLRATPGVRFAKLLGVGAGRGFGPGDADPTRYAALVVADDPAVAHLSGTPTARAWARLATAACRIDLSPLASRGRWSGAEPFQPPLPDPDQVGMVLALTRARLRPGRALTFWQAVPPVAAALHGAPGLLARLGIGEAPIGWQGTISVWRTRADLLDFAYRSPEHRRVITRTGAIGWYAEELFARLAVRGVTGDRALLGWVDEGTVD